MRAAQANLRVRHEARRGPHRPIAYRCIVVRQHGGADPRFGIKVHAPKRQMRFCAQVGIKSPPGLFIAVDRVAFRRRAVVQVAEPEAAAEPAEKRNVALPCGRFPDEFVFAAETEIAGVGRQGLVDAVAVELSVAVVMDFAAEDLCAEAFDADSPLIANREQRSALVDEIGAVNLLIPVEVIDARVPTCDRRRHRHGRGG